MTGTSKKPLISLEQVSLLAQYNLDTYEGKTNALLQATNIMSSPNEEDYRNIFEAVTTKDFDIDTGYYLINTLFDTDQNDGWVGRTTEIDPITNEKNISYSTDILDFATRFKKEEASKLPALYQLEAAWIPEAVAHRQLGDDHYQEWMDKLVATVETPFLVDGKQDTQPVTVNVTGETEGEKPKHATRITRTKGIRPRR